MKTQAAIESRVTRLENAHLDENGQPLETVIIFLPDNGRDGDSTGRTGNIIIYSRETPQAAIVENKGREL